LSAFLEIYLITELLCIEITVLDITFGDSPVYTCKVAALVMYPKKEFGGRGKDLGI